MCVGTKTKGFSIENYKIELPKGLIELLEDSDDEFEMYFKTPEQIQDIFQSLEEKNQFMIKNTQVDEQGLDEVRQKYKRKKEELTEKRKQLIQNHQELEKMIQVRIL